MKPTMADLDRLTADLCHELTTDPHAIADLAEYVALHRLGAKHHEARLVERIRASVAAGEHDAVAVGAAVGIPWQTVQRLSKAHGIPLALPDYERPPEPKKNPGGRPRVQPKACRLETCDKTSQSRGLCQSHYYRLRKFGDPYEEIPFGFRGKFPERPKI